jgi:myo-inositol-1(or 4)-monophosphatase
MDPDQALAPMVAFLHELAEASAREILPRFGQRDVGLELKSDASPVTVADREAERVMREMINRRFPSHGIVGEEFGTERPDADFVWVLDPIDGTKSFISAVPLFGTLIGLMHEGKPVLGCIHQPVLRQLVIGNGRVTTLNGTPVQGRPCASIEHATLVMSDPMHPAVYQDGARFEAVCRKARVVRSWGDCYGYLLVASGWVDIMLDPIMNPWDLQPVIPIIRGAGGIITDWKGNSADRMGADSAVAAMPGVHDAVLRMLNG